jgi:hypothetical protein
MGVVLAASGLVVAVAGADTPAESIRPELDDSLVPAVESHGENRRTE